VRTTDGDHPSERRGGKEKQVEPESIGVSAKEGFRGIREQESFSPKPKPHSPTKIICPFPCLGMTPGHKNM
jgi:hypothetical protein